MAAFGTLTVLGVSRQDRLKSVTFKVVGGSSYATGGDTLDLSAATLGKVNGFSKRVDCVTFGGINAAASTKYLPVYVPAASGAPATGVVKVHDTSAAADAEVTNATDISAATFFGVAWGE